MAASAQFGAMAFKLDGKDRRVVINAAGYLRGFLSTERYKRFAAGREVSVHFLDLANRSFGGGANFGFL